MTQFSTYWNKKAQKKRKSWAAKAKRYAEQHTGIEVVRKDMYRPLDFNPNFHLDDLKFLHFTAKNPLIQWDKAVFSFSEESLRAALMTEEDEKRQSRFIRGIHDGSIKIEAVKPE